MSVEYKNVYDAKKCLKAHIKFFESLLIHLNETDEIMKSRAMWTSWSLNNYINEQLVKDIEWAIKTYGEDIDAG